MRRAGRKKLSWTERRRRRCAGDSQLTPCYLSSIWQTDELGSIHFSLRSAQLLDATTRACRASRSYLAMTNKTAKAVFARNALARNVTFG